MEEQTQTITSTNSGKPHEIIEGMVSIIIPIYLTDYSLLHYTGNCIGSVREHTAAKYEIVVVDNGSPLNLQDPQMYKADKYIRNESNIGVTKAWNQGIRMSQGEYIVLLNNDTMVFDEWLNELKDTLENGKLELVMATPMYGEPFARAHEAMLKRDEWCSKPLGESLSQFKDFACVMFRRKLIEEIGGFDEIFYNYASDTDFLKRIELNGGKYASTKRVPIFHIINATGNALSDNPEVMNKDKEAYAKKWEKQDLSYQGEPNEPEGGPFIGESMNPETHPDPSPSPEPEAEGVPEGVKQLKVFRTHLTGDKVFLLGEDKSHWITSAQILDQLGYTFDDVQTIFHDIFKDCPEGEAITPSNVEKFA